jgi:hypothetical protein
LEQIQITLDTFEQQSRAKEIKTKTNINPDKKKISQIGNNPAKMK